VFVLKRPALFVLVQDDTTLLSYCANGALGDKLAPAAVMMTQAALYDISGVRTVPQVFIGGKFVGGSDGACSRLARRKSQPISAFGDNLLRVPAKPGDSVMDCIERRLVQRGCHATGTTADQLIWL